MIDIKTAKQIGKVLRKLRLMKDITQQEIADKIMVNRASYTSYELGRRIPEDEVKYRIARYYGLTVDEIFFRPSGTNSAERRQS